MSNPVFIIGAGRSGTNILRNVLTSFSDMNTWPCDELDLVFRHGNRGVEDDRFIEKHANKISKKYIQSFFNDFQQKNTNATIVEKTCANSLRVPYLKSLFPQAKFIFIIRNGFDVTKSAKLRWTSAFDLSYTLKKLKFVPKSDIPFYFFKFLKNRISQFGSSEKRLSKWGPVYPGMFNDLKDKNLDEVCALQWKNCVQFAHNDLLKLPKESVFYLSYENLVTNPEPILDDIKIFLNKTWDRNEIKQASSLIKSDKIGRGSDSYTNNSNILSIINPVMKSIYEPLATNYKKTI